MCRIYERRLECRRKREWKNYHVDPSVKQMVQAASYTVRTAILAISGMDCPQCIMRVRNGLLNLRGVLLANAYLASCIAVVAYDPGRVTAVNLTGAVAEASLEGRHYYQARFLSIRTNLVVE